MGKDKTQQPELTLEAFNRAIRTYQRDDVSYLIAHGILKDVPADEKIATYRQLVALQSMDILQAIAKQEPWLDPQIFCCQSDSSQSKVFIGQCLTKFRKQFRLQDAETCDTLFELSCECGCTSMLHTLIEQKKCKSRYSSLSCYSLDVLKLIKDVPQGQLSDDELVQLYYKAAVTADHEKKLDFLAANGYDLFRKDSSGKTVLDYLQERIEQNKYTKNRHGSLMQIEDRKMFSKLKKMLDEKEHPPVKQKADKRTVACFAAIAVIAVILIIIAVASSLGGDDADEVSLTETTEVWDLTDTEDTSYSTDTSLTVADGDTVNIDYVGYVDGEEFDGGNTDGEGTDLVIGSGSYIDDFEDQLIGANVGDTVEVNVTFPDEYSNNPDLAGKDATFEVTINGIYE